jgi:phosphotriesterase-related protein
MVRTVLGDIPSSSLGLTLIHEHLMNQTGSLVGDEDANLADAAIIGGELADAMNHGISTLVEVSTFEMQRNVTGIVSLAKALGLNIVLSTGFFYGPFLPQAVCHASTQRLSEAMVNDLRGNNFWSIAAGVIGEIGISPDGPTEGELRVHEAAASAHDQTGCSIITHTCNGDQAVEQARLLIQKGVNPASILICHVDADRPLDDHLAVLATGVNVSLDRVGDLRRSDDESRARRVVELVERGYAKKVMLSHDLARKSRLTQGGGHGYKHLASTFLPRLRKLGLPEQEIKQITVTNPATFLDWYKVDTHET